MFFVAAGIKHGEESVLELATWLVEKGADVNVVGCDEYETQTPLCMAASAVLHGKKDGLALATMLLKAGARNVNVTGTDPVEGCGSTPLWLAAAAVASGESDGLALARMLVKNKADVNKVGSVEAIWTYEGGKGPIALQKLGRILGGEVTPLVLAALGVREDKPGAKDLVRLLVSHGAALAERERAVFQVYVDRVSTTTSALDLALRASSPTSLAVAWSRGTAAAGHHSVTLQLPSGTTLSCPKLGAPVEEYTFKVGHAIQVVNIVKTHSLRPPV